MRRIVPTRPPRPSRRAVAGLLAGLALLVPAALWLRDAPFVRVERVEVSGIGGPEAAQVRRAITAAARDMSTLHVRAGRLREAVRGYPIVEDLKVSRRLPSTLRVVVRERVPVAALAQGSRRVAVAADGTILPSTSPVGLPLVAVTSPPGGARVADRGTRRLIALLGAAPAALRAHVAAAEQGANGLTAQLVRGPEVYFGSAERLAAKWAAAARVLADTSSKGASYVDVRVPERPAAGGLEPSNPKPQVEGLP